MACPLACKQGKAMAAPQHRRHSKLKIEARLRGRGRLQFLIRALTVFMRDRLIFDFFRIGAIPPDRINKIPTWISNGLSFQ